MDLCRSPGGVVVVVSPAGELDLATAPALREALLEACLGTERLVVVDLRLVTFADSSAMAVLVAAFNRVADEGRSFLMVNAHGRALKVLRLTGLTSVMDVREPGEQLDDEVRGLLQHPAR
jgi:anti-anti-sigma factor